MFYLSCPARYLLCFMTADTDGYGIVFSVSSTRLDILGSIYT